MQQITYACQTRLQPACCSLRMILQACLASGRCHKHDEALRWQRCHTARVHGHQARRKAVPLSLLSSTLHSARQPAQISKAGGVRCRHAACGENARSAALLSIASLGAVQDNRRVWRISATS